MKNIHWIITFIVQDSIIISFIVLGSITLFHWVISWLLELEIIWSIFHLGHYGVNIVDET